MCFKTHGSILNIKKTNLLINLLINLFSCYSKLAIAITILLYWLLIKTVYVINCILHTQTRKHQLINMYVGF